ncbi:MAG: 2Fe-2S iron-sulfur cluster-binding protein [Sphingomonadales bacterium]
MKKIVEFTLNGCPHTGAVDDNILLIDYLREAGLTGTKTGCDGGECGACTVLIDDQPALACLTLAAGLEGKHIETIEEQSKGGALSDIQTGFHKKLGSQCGFCSPGFVMATEALLRRNPTPNDDEIREALSSNICRCTGYVKIIEAVKWAAKERGRGAS